MENIVAINQGRKPYSMSLGDVPAVAVEEASRLLRTGCALLDVRSHELFGRGYVPGAYNIQLSSGAFEQNVGWILPPDVPLLLVAESPDTARLAAYKLAFVGLDQRVRGVLALEAWRASGMPILELAHIDVDRLDQELRKERMRVLDVRDVAEWNTGHIASALHVSVKQLPTMIDRLPVDRENPLAVICAAGMRSSTACSLLLKNGFSHVYSVTGGMDAWRKASLPIQQT